MATTLTHSATTLTLSDDLRWADEAEWSPVEQTVERTLTGALIVSTADRTNVGRPITLDAPDDSSAWMPRATLDQLMAWAAIPGRQMTLVMRGVTRTVMFRHHEPPVLQATPVVFFSDIDAADHYTLTIRLMQV